MGIMRCQKVSARGGAIYRVQADAGDQVKPPKETYIVESPNALSFQLRLWICGAPLRARVVRAGIDLFGAAQQMGLLPQYPKDLFEVCITTGGLTYQLPVAFYEGMGGTLQRSLISCRRFRKEGKGWNARVESYLNFEAFEEIDEGRDKTIVIGDTIATGGTLATVIPFLIRWFKERGEGLERILVLSHAASLNGLNRLREVGEETGISLAVATSNVIAHLRDDGTALRWEDPGYPKGWAGGEAIVPEPISSQVNKFFGCEWLKGEINLCGDWGKRGNAPLGHLNEALLHYEYIMTKARREGPEEACIKVGEMIDATQQMIDLFSKPLSYTE